MTTTALIEQVRKGDVAAVTAMLDQDPGLLAAKADNGVSAILLAMYHGHPEVAQLFIARGATLDVFEAAATGLVPRVRELVVADLRLVNVYSADGFYPLGLAAFFGHRDVVALLLERGADVKMAARNPMRVTALHAAVARRDSQIVKMLIERGADVNARQQAGFTPLHAAAQHGEMDIVRALVAAGAEVGTKSDEGRTAADYAREKGHEPVAAWLDGRTG